jgi:hypothetical protein
VRVAAVAAAFVVLASCAKESTPRTTHTPTPTAAHRLTGNGIRGTVTAGPSCPVQRIDEPCPDKPVRHAKVTARGTTTKSTQTDPKGSFSMSLPPGTYDVSAETSSVASCELERVTVYRNVYTQVPISCDTGIR